MAETLIAWRSSSADTIEQDLSVLWREAAHTSPVSRALMANLVVIQEDSRVGGSDPGNRAGDLRTAVANGSAQETLAADIARQHPVRAILLGYIPGIERACAPYTARVGLCTFGLPDARYGIELIAIQTACAEASIPSIVRRLTRGHVPTAIWWRGDISQTRPGLATMLGRQFLYDSAGWRDSRAGMLAIADITARPQAPDIADLNWRRLAPMRQAIVHGLGSEPRARELRAADVDIRCGAGRTASAWLLAGWFHASLRWSPNASPRIELGSGSAELGVTMRGLGWSVDISLSEGRVQVTGSTQRPFALSLPRGSEADQVAAELRSLGRDTHLDAAVRSAAILSQ
jgi:glucose-6-phosphate dehydrogenase assembly protein OpcA